MIAQVLIRYWARLTSFSPNARYYLLSEVIIGLSYGIYALIFNL